MSQDYCNKCEMHVVALEVNMTDDYNGYDIICPHCSQSNTLELNKKGSEKPLHKQIIKRRKSNG